jgi:hypothetical protein
VLAHDEPPPEEPAAYAADEEASADAELEARPPRPRRPALDGSLTASRERVIGSHGRIGLGILVASLFLFLAVFAFAWFQDAGGGSLDRGQAQQSLLDQDVDYLARLATMPVWGLAFSAAGGLALVAADVTATTRARHLLARIVGGSLAVYGGFLCLLTAARLLGYWIGEALDAGSASFSLHIVPYLLLVGGAAIVVAAGVTVGGALVPLRRLRPDIDLDRAQRIAASAGAAAVALLLVLPLVPLASSFDDFDDETHLTEPEIYREARTFSIGDRAIQKVADSLDTAHLVAWLSIGVCALTYAAAVVGRLRVAEMAARLVLQSFVVNAILWVILLFSTLRLYFSHIPDVELGFFASDDYVAAFNHFLPVYLVVVAAAVTRFFITINLPFIRELRASGSEDAANEVS